NWVQHFDSFKARKTGAIGGPTPSLGQVWFSGSACPCYKEASDHQVTSYHRIISLQQVRQCLAEGYPFVFGFSVYEAFEGDEVACTGKLDLPDTSEKQLGGHAVMDVGYDASAEHVLVRNSWGTDWGIKGYFTMPYDYISDDNLVDDLWTIRGLENV